MRVCPEGRLSANPCWPEGSERQFQVTAPRRGSTNSTVTKVWEEDSRHTFLILTSRADSALNWFWRAAEENKEKSPLTRKKWQFEFVVMTAHRFATRKHIKCRLSKRAATFDWHLGSSSSFLLSFEMGRRTKYWECDDRKTAAADFFVNLLSRWAFCLVSVIFVCRFFLFSFVVVILFWGFCVLVLAVVFSYLFWGVFCTSIEQPSNVAALFRSSPKGRRQTIALVIDSLVCHTDECEKAFRVVGQRV